jgi:NAD(P)-dependent dehydrogenase (short-subunit alcohol dehydrogenase family)
MSVLAGTVDAALEASVVGSFTRVGPQVRSRTDHWHDGTRLDGCQVVVTGATSGIGLALATDLGRRGAALHLLGRDQGRTEHAAEQVRATGAAAPIVHVVDLADLAEVARMAAELGARAGELHALVHNAGTLSPRYETGPDGTETTYAVQVLAPFLLTELLLPALMRGTRAAPARVVTVSSGGMYTERSTVDGLELPAAHYRGSVAYARAKRAQVQLTHAWARRCDPHLVVHHAMHPGWVDTPGLARSMPHFHRVLGPLLRTPAEGADTAAWLVASREAAASTGGFWLDRRRRGEHRLPWTRHGASPEAVWEHCRQRTRRYVRERA